MVATEALHFRVMCLHLPPEGRLALGSELLTLSTFGRDAGGILFLVASIEVCDGSSLRRLAFLVATDRFGVLGDPRLFGAALFESAFGGRAAGGRSWWARRRGGSGTHLGSRTSPARDRRWRRWSCRFR